MKNDNIILDKSFQFGLRIVKLFVHLRKTRETRYWLRLLKESELLESKLAESFISDCEEIIKILTAILNSTKNKQIPEV